MKTRTDNRQRTEDFDSFLQHRNEPLKQAIVILLALRGRDAPDAVTTGPASSAHTYCDSCDRVLGRKAPESKPKD